MHRIIFGTSCTDVPRFDGCHGIWLSAPRSPCFLLLFLIPWKTKTGINMDVHTIFSSVISKSQPKNAQPGHLRFFGFVFKKKHFSPSFPCYYLAVVKSTKSLNCLICSFSGKRIVLCWVKCCILYVEDEVLIFFKWYLLWESILLLNCYVFLQIEHFTNRFKMALYGLKYFWGVHYL